MKYLLTQLLFLFSYLSICSQNSSLNYINKKRLNTDLIQITKTQKSRNFQNIKTLNTVANYIKNDLAKVCDSVAFQPFLLDKKTYKNVIGSIGLNHKERIIIGAHYDVCGNQQGADDNASGVAGLLELARLLSKESLNYRIDFVAYTLEEPPFFRTQQMGSYIHANYLKSKSINVKGMMSLEMIGYYSDKENSQQYPVSNMALMYGNVADFIAVVQSEKSGEFGNQIATSMKNQNLIKTISFKGSSSISGVDYSDHLNYWKFDFPAIMITNTSFYRNKNYHTKNDTIETLNLDKMGAVIEQLFYSIKNLE